LSVVGAEVAAGFDLANAAYDSVSFSVAGQDPTPYGVFFKPDGTKMFISGDSNDSIYEYNLSTAWDISTASFVQSFETAKNITTGMFFKPDGISFYLVDFESVTVDQYLLNSAWDISTASYVQSFNVSAQDTVPIGLFFKDDGTKMYVLGVIGQDVNEYNLSTAWNISTASFVQNLSLSAQETSPRVVFFKPDGLKMYIVGHAGDDVNEYDLSTAWDVSTASYSQNFSVAAQDTSPQGIFWGNNGTKMYIVGNSTDTIYQYSTAGTPAPATFTYPASVAWPSGTAPDAPAVGETDILEFSTTDGGTTWYGVRTGDAMA